MKRVDINWGVINQGKIILVDKKDELIIYLKSKGIATGCHYTPLHTQPLFADFSGPCPVAEEEYLKMITLPLHAELTNEEVRYIITSLNFFEKAK